MKAMALTRPAAGMLEPVDCAPPAAADGQVRVHVRACAVCRTDLHIVDGELADPAVPRIPGHEIVGIVDQVGAGVGHLKAGDRVGIPWLGYACGVCAESRRDVGRGVRRGAS